MIDGLANTHAMYKPKMIAVSTTCMAEVIGDDLNAFIKTAKEKGSVPAEYDVPFAHTPCLRRQPCHRIRQCPERHRRATSGTARPETAPKLERQPNNKINFIGGFDGYTVGNTREIKRIFELMGIEYTILADNSDVFDTPTDGEFRMYDGGTTLEDAANAIHAKATVFDAALLHRKDAAVHCQPRPGGGVVPSPDRGHRDRRLHHDAVRGFPAWRTRSS